MPAHNRPTTNRRGSIKQYILLRICRVWFCKKMNIFYTSLLTEIYLCLWNRSSRFIF